eukprot:12279035-Alexandrium_andersonii.AAC.1
MCNGPRRGERRDCCACAGVACTGMRERVAHTTRPARVCDATDNRWCMQATAASERPRTADVMSTAPPNKTSPDRQVKERDQSG